MNDNPCTIDHLQHSNYICQYIAAWYKFSLFWHKAVLNNDVAQDQTPDHISKAEYVQNLKLLDKLATYTFADDVGTLQSRLD